MEAKIPRPVLAVVAAHFSELCSHTELDRLLDRSGAPPADPGSNKEAKIRNRLSAANHTDDPLAVLGKLVEDLFDGSFVRKDPTAVERAKLEIKRQFEQFGWHYATGGRLSLSTASPSHQSATDVPGLPSSQQHRNPGSGRGEVSIMSPSQRADRPRDTVFIIYGRNAHVVTELTKYLQALQLKVVQFNELSSDAGPNAPVFEIVKQGVARSGAVIALFTPDEWSVLEPSLRSPSDKQHEVQRYQPRPNVLYEAGLAFALNPDATVLVSLGNVDVPSDLHGIHVVRLNDGVDARKLLRDKLVACGLTVEMSGVQYLNTKISTFSLGYEQVDPATVAPGSTARSRLSRAVERVRVVLQSTAVDLEHVEACRQELSATVKAMGPEYADAASRIFANQFSGVVPSTANALDAVNRQRLKTMLAVATGVLNATE